MGNAASTSAKPVEKIAIASYDLQEASQDNTTSRGDRNDSSRSQHAGVSQRFVTNDANACCELRLLQGPKQTTGPVEREDETLNYISKSSCAAMPLFIDNLTVGDKIWTREHQQQRANTDEPWSRVPSRTGARSNSVPHVRSGLPHRHSHENSRCV